MEGHSLEFPTAEFNVNYLTAFSVVVKDEEATSLPKPAQVDRERQSIECEKDIDCSIQCLGKICPSVAQALPKYNEVFILLCKQECSLQDMMEVVSDTSRRSFVRNFVKPMMDAGLLLMTHPENPRFPHQKYYLTEQGVKILRNCFDSL